jgi:hypothetical protein
MARDRQLDPIGRRTFAASSSSLNARAVCACRGPPCGCGGGGGSGRLAPAMGPARAAAARTASG